MREKGLFLLTVFEFSVPGQLAVLVLGDETVLRGWKAVSPVENIPLIMTYDLFTLEFSTTSW